MERLPIIVDFGEINSAKISSFQQMHNRLIIDKLKSDKAEQTYIDLAMHMNLISCKDGNYVDSNGAIVSPSQGMSRFGQTVHDDTLINWIERSRFAVEGGPFNSPMIIKPSGVSPLKYTAPPKDLPAQLPRSGVPVRSMKILQKLPSSKNLT